MSIVVAYKYAANPQDALVKDDGEVDWSRVKPALSDYDPVAITVGRSLADTVGSDLVGISVGGKSVGSSMAKKTALSRGLDRALVVADEETASWNASKTASALAELVVKVPDVELVLTGDSSIDEGARITSALIAGYLGWPCFQDVCAVEPAEAGYRVSQIEAGGVKVLEVSTPAVLAMSSDAVTVKPPAMREVLAANKKPLEVVSISDLDIASIEPEILGSSKPESKTRKQKIFSGENAASELIAALHSENVL